MAAHDLREGVQEARRHPWFVAGLGGLLPVMALGCSATSVALPLVSRDRFGGETVLAVAITAYTVGAIVGAALVARWRPTNVGWWAFAGLGAYALVPLGLALLAPAISAWGLTPVLLACAAACALGAALAATPRTSRTLGNSVSTDSVSTDSVSTGP